MMAKQMILRVRRFVAVSGVLVALTGCSGSDLSRAFGLERSMPDEYTVTTQPPLSMPPGVISTFPEKAGASSMTRPVCRRLRRWHLKWLYAVRQSGQCRAA